MHFTIELVQGYLRAELFGRVTVEQTQEFLQALAAEAQKHACTKALIAVRNSRSIFKVEGYGLSERFKQLAGNPAIRIALRRLGGAAHVAWLHRGARAPAGR